MKRKIAAILASDVAGYSRLIAEDEEGTLARLEAYRAVFADLVGKAGGRIFNTAGDAILAEFPSAVEATRCAIAIQETIRLRNGAFPASRQMLFRIGITIGDVVERENGDLLGDGVNIAARLEGLAEAGGICVSRNIFEQVGNKISASFVDIGENEVKNMPQPVHAFRIGPPGSAAAAPVGLLGPSARRPAVKDRRAGGAGLVLALGGLGMAAAAGAAGAWLWAGRVPVQPDVRVPMPPPVPPVTETLKPPAPAPKIASAPQPPVKPAEPAPVKPLPSEPQQANPVVKPQASPQARPAPASTPQASSPPQQAAPQPPVETAQPSGAERQAMLDPPPAIAPQETRKEPPRAAPQPPVHKPQAQTPPVQAQVPPRVVIPPGTPPDRAYAIIAKSGGIVPDAATAPELYHNARTYEARGDVAAARRDYLKAAELSPNFIDPHLRLAAFLRAQDGAEGARPVFEKLAAGGKNPAAALVLALQMPDSEKRKRLLQFIAANPAFAPAHYLLAEEFGAERASQTIGERKQQFSALQNFIAAHDKRQLPAFFLDQSITADWNDKARSRFRALEHFLKTAKLDPQTQFTRSNSGWMVSISLPEPATKIYWRSGESGEFRPTGELRSIDQRTGKPAPNPSFEMPASTPQVRLFIRYDDALGEPQGPFAVDFEPRAELMRSQSDLLRRFTNNWIAINPGGQAKRMLYFTHLVSHRCAISRIELLFDDSPLAMNLTLPPCDPQDPHRIPSGARVFMPMPASAKQVTVTLRFADGGSPQKRTFDAR